ncbi:MAG: mitochondrial fission ELM1 family protein [Rudaea sp.]|nr:mitochondrial fission ELM1 family protein [Rudaea sp.]
MTQPIPPPTPSAHTRAPDSAHAWAISDGTAGNERQALALAGAMGLATSVHRIALHAPWRWFAPRLTAAIQLGMPSAQRGLLAPPWPEFAIGCGRQAALITRALRVLSGGATFTVQILDPRVDPAQFDLLVAPRHDNLEGSNVIRTLGALNPVDAAWLSTAALEFSTLQQLPQPRTALLVGGPHRELLLDADWFDGLIAQLEALLGRDGGSLMITLSRRTPTAWAERLRGAFHSGCAYFWGSARDGANPYAGYLAHADRIVVTPDSVNMLSEACATGKPVMTWLPHPARGKLAAFHAALRAQGLLHGLGEADPAMASTTSLREAPAVADEVWQRYRARRAQSPPG